jgi:restriction endonuclease S subunit
MSTYTISNTKLNPNRVFILQKSELEKRFDPAYYYELRNNKFEFAYSSKTISRIVKSYSGGTPNKSNIAYWNGNICWASPKDMKDFYLSDTQDKITFAGVKNSSTKIAPIGSVLIVFRSGILQHTLPVSVTKVESSINQDLKVLVPSKGLLPEYLAIFLKTFEKRILPRIVKHSTTVQSINQEDFNRLSIPIPKIEIQKIIIGIYKTYLIQKKQNEAETEKLLASIDDYLLGELGIKLPELPENNLENRMFTVSLKEISGGRFDPKLYDNTTQAIRNAIEKANFDKPKLKELVTSSIAGDWGKDENENLADNFKRCLVIRATEFDNLYNLNLDNSRVKYRLINSGKLDRIDIQENDLLIEKSGGSPDQPVGRISILTNDILKTHQIGYSNFIHKIRVDNSKINSEYLFCFLKTVHNIKLTDAMQSQTNGIRNLIMSNYFNQIIPLPKIDKQKEIANHISEIRKQAQKLKNQTAEALKSASNEIEKILLN